MFRKPQKPRSGKKPNLSQFGLLDIDNMDDDAEPMDGSDDDMDLEAELAAISGGGGRNRPRKPVPVPAADLDAMIAASLKDIPSDDDASGDDDDPELLNELKDLALEDEPAPPAAPPAAVPRVSSADSSTVSLLQDRITNYTVAEKNAKAAGESSRARRFGRGLKTLHDLLKQAKSGASIANDDIPPPVNVGNTPAPAPAPEPVSEVPEAAPAAPEPVAEPRAPARPAPAIPDSPSSPPPSMPPPLLPTEAPAPAPPPPPRAASLRSPAEPAVLDPARQEGLQIILKRKKEFMAAALASKHTDKPLALEYLKVVKQFDMVADAWKSGQEMDLTELPSPDAVAAAFRSQQKGEDQTQGATEAPPEAPAPEQPALITATTMAEALKQRLAGFQEQEAKAKEQGNSSKARRMGRIVKQYQEAIKLHAAGKPVPVDELPPIAGYGPIPTEGSPPAAAAAPRPAPAPAPPGPAPPAPAPPGPAPPAPAPPGPAPPAPAPPGPAPPAPAHPGAARPAPAPPGPRAPAPTVAHKATRYDKQLALLLHRQKEFRDAALRAKKDGNIEQAKEYLRAAKGFDAVIDAAKGGLAVDLKSLPLPPQAKKQLEHTFDVVTAEDCTPADDEPITGSDDDILTRLHQQLASQLKLCQANRDHYRAMGNIAEMNRFEHLAVRVKQDLDVVVVAKSLNHNPPKFHYESRQFAVVQCNTDLNENDLELTIVRGIAYNVPNPKEVDTYVKFEFPYPQDAPVVDRTSQVKDTNNPEYGAVFPLAIRRTDRPCLRVFKRHGIKFEVYSRGGWFSRDSLLGSCNVKLAPLETQVTIHEAYPLMDGRRPAGGSLEVKLRVRTPLLQQQITSTTHRWLVVDS